MSARDVRVTNRCGRHIPCGRRGGGTESGASAAGTRRPGAACDPAGAPGEREARRPPPAARNQSSAAARLSSAAPGVPAGPAASRGPGGVGGERTQGGGFAGASDSRWRSVPHQTLSDRRSSGPKIVHPLDEATYRRGAESTRSVLLRRGAQQPCQLPVLCWQTLRWRSSAATPRRRAGPVRGSSRPAQRGQQRTRSRAGLPTPATRGGSATGAATGTAVIMGSRFDSAETGAGAGAGI